VVQHAYSSEGTYTVILTVTDNDGGGASIQKTIKVSRKEKPPVANFSFTPLRPVAREVVHFIDASYDEDGYIINYTWSFGDGNVSYGGEINHSYTSAGNYNVTLTVTDNDGSIGTFSKNIEILPSLPDLVVDEIRYSVIKNGDIEIIVTVRNDGTEDTGNFSCTLEVDGGMCDQEFVDNIRPGGMVNISFYADISKGKHLLNASVDTSNEIKEGNEYNNYKTYSIYVSSSSPLKVGWKIAALFGIMALVLISIALLKRKKEMQEMGQSNKKVKVEPEEEVHRCFVCFGKIKPGSPFIKCDCGAVFHKSCAERVKKCPNCGKELKEKW